MTKTKSKFRLLKKQPLILMLIYGLTLTSASAQDKIKPSKTAPLFTEFSYEGKDRIYQENPLKADEFYTPILQGCYPDPSITRKGDDYYLINSSFVMFPGVPIFHSNDLVNWKQIGHVLDRPSQLKVQTAGISAGIYAPDIKYNPYNDTFYMITTQISAGMGNMVVKTKDPKAGWSDPVKLDFQGIDPAIFFDDDGKAYLLHNDAPDKGKALYEGHRVIKMWDYDLQNDRVVPGSDKIIVDGGTDISQKPIWIEGPHLYKKDGRYFLICAEGGTGGWHSEVVFVSESATGPFIPAPNNPILTQRYFGKNRTNKIDWAGHADIVEGPNGKYYGVFLGIRPNDKDLVNTGRETFLLPVDWSGEFPVFENGLVPLKTKLKLPEGTKNQTGKNGFLPNGNFTFKEDFKAKNLDFSWIGIRGPREDFITTTKQGLRITPFDKNIKEAVPVSILFRRQQHASFEANVTMNYSPASQKDLSGLVCYQSEKFHYTFAVTKKGKDSFLLLARTEKGKTTVISSEKINSAKPVKLKVSADGDNYRFSYANGSEYKNMGLTVSGDILSTNVAGGFTGALIGLYATSANDIEL